MAIETRNYPAFGPVPVTGPFTGPPRMVIEGRVIRVQLTGTAFAAQVQISNATNTGAAPGTLFLPAESDWITAALLNQAAPTVDLTAPVRWLRVKLTSGTASGTIEEDTRNPGVTAETLETAIVNSDAVQGLKAAGGGTVGEYGGVVQALATAPAGQTLNIQSGGTVPPVVDGGTLSLTGRGIHAPLTLEAGSTTRDLLTIRPPQDSNQYAGLRLQDLLLVASTGRDAIRIDLTGGSRRMSRLLLDNVHAVGGAGGWGLNVQNELTELDAISNSYVLGGAYVGGINIQGGGDSIVLRDVQITGGRGLHVALNHKGAGGGGADASQFLVSGLNSTGATGIYVITGTRFRLEYGNLELPLGGSGTGNALVYLQGGADLDSAIEGATILGNYLAPIQAGKSAIRLGNTNGTQVVNNTITAPATTYGVVIDGNARNTVIGPNLWVVSPGYEVQDGGVGTMGIYKPLPLNGAGRAAVAGRPAPRFIKQPTGRAGTVQLSGIIGGGSAYAGDVLAILPDGFRPVVGTYDQFPVRYVSPGATGWTTITVNSDGTVVLDEQLLGDALTSLNLSGVSFEALLVP